MTNLIGQDVRLFGTFQDNNGVLIDPTSIFFKFITPTGMLTTYEFGVGGEVVKKSVGSYYVDLNPIEVGTYNYRWETQGNAAIILEGSVLVENSIFDTPVEIIIEDGSGVPNANSYISLTEAENYFITRPHSSKWVSGNHNTKISALIWATQLLDQEINWMGRKQEKGQSLGWPRNDIIDEDGFMVGVLPRAIKIATVELALNLIPSDRTQDPDTKGFEKIKIGELELVINKNDRSRILPDSVVRIISQYGSVKNKKKNIAKLGRV